MKPTFSDEVQKALKAANRSPGWNNRPRDVRRFVLAGHYGADCTLYVVPFACWAYRRRDRIAAAWRAEQAQG